MTCLALSTKSVVVLELGRAQDQLAQVYGELLSEHHLHRAGVGEELEEGHGAGWALAEQRAAQVVEIRLTLYGGV